MTLKLLGKKRGMTRVFDEKGNQVVCTVISAEPNIVTQVKQNEKDGYKAIQLGAFKVKASKLRNVKKPLKGHFAKAGIEPYARLFEVRLGEEESFEVGQAVGLSHFVEDAYIDVQAVTKGKGYQGVMKRHNFAGGPASHGSGFHRHGGSTGMRSTPGRCLPGQKKAGHMGAEVMTVQSLRVVRVDEERQVILVEGAVPGARGSAVYVAKSMKKSGQKRKKKD